MKNNELEKACGQESNDLSAAAPAQSETHAPDLLASAAAPLFGAERSDWSFVPEPQFDDLVNCGTISLGKADDDGLFRLPLIKKEIRKLINILRLAIGDDKESPLGKARAELNDHLTQQNLPPLVPLS